MNNVSAVTMVGPCCIVITVLYRLLDVSKPNRFLVPRFPLPFSSVVTVPAPSEAETDNTL